MTTKLNYTEEEWNGLLYAPYMVGMYIIMADISVTAMGKEMKGMIQALQTQDVPEAAKDLVGSIVADIMSKAQNKEKLEQPIEQQENALDQIMDSIIKDTAVLDTKSTPEEKAAFNQWLMKIAQATAEVGREGGFLGIGSVRVSDKEKTALAELARVLNVRGEV